MEQWLTPHFAAESWLFELPLGPAISLLEVQEPLAALRIYET
jgi:hypothetical protein